MEDPCRFDVWAQIIRGAAHDAALFVSEWRHSLTPLELRREINRSMVQGEAILIASRVTWSQAQHIRDTPPSWASEIGVYQENYGPKDFAHPMRFRGHCKSHDLFYGGSLGCHVCNGFFVQ